MDRPGSEMLFLVQLRPGPTTRKACRSRVCGLRMPAAPPSKDCQNIKIIFKKNVSLIILKRHLHLIIVKKESKFNHTEREPEFNQIQKRTLIESY